MEKATVQDPLQFDKRVMSRFVKKGIISNKDVENHLETLPDLKDQFDDISDEVYEHFTDSNKKHQS